MKQAPKTFNSKLWLLFVMAFLYSYKSVKAQTSVFQDASGESAFKVFGSAITINSSNQNVSFSSDVINRDDGTHFKFNRWGVKAKLNANEGLANLKDEDGFLIDGELGIYIGWKKTSPIGAGVPLGTGWTHEKYMSLNGDIDRNKLYDLNRAKDKITFNKGYAGWKLEAGWFGYYGTLLWGVSLNGGQKTNIADIKQKSISTVVQSAYKDSVVVYKQVSAYSNEELKHDLRFFNANIDLATSLTKNVGNNIGPLLLALHLRYQALQNDKGKFNPAIGLYVAKVGAPQDIVVGINAQFQDLLNAGKSDNNSWQRLTFNLTAGFKLN